MRPIGFRLDLAARTNTLRLLPLILTGLSLVACAERERAESATTDRPMRILSLDYCADQYVLRLVERDRILAVSPDATAPFSYMRDTAAGVPQVRPLAEDALVLQPDLVVRSYGGGPGAATLFERAGVPVLQIGWASDLDGIARVIMEMGDGLGAPAEARRVVQDMETRLDRLNRPGAPIRALYLTPSGTTSGPGSLTDATLTAAGLRNFETRPGWHTLSLEQIVREQPDLVATAYFDDPRSRLDPWSFIRHPVAKSALADVPKTDLDRAWVSCGSWSAVDAIEALNEAALDGLAVSMDRTP